MPYIVVIMVKKPMNYIVTSILEPRLVTNLAEIMMELSDLLEGTRDHPSISMSR